jgi:hypothetical protein
MENSRRLLVEGIITLVNVNSSHYVPFQSCNPLVIVCVVVECPDIFCEILLTCLYYRCMRLQSQQYSENLINKKNDEFLQISSFNAKNNLYFFIIWTFFIGLLVINAQKLPKNKIPNAVKNNRMIKSTKIPHNTKKVFKGFCIAIMNATDKDLYQERLYSMKTGILKKATGKYNIVKIITA